MRGLSARAGRARGRLRLALLVLAAAGVAVYLRLAPPAEVPAAAGRAPTPAPDAAFPAPPPAAALPPADAPLLDVVVDLQRLADAGDTLAACRLGMELLRCQQMESIGVGLESDAMGRQQVGVDGMMHAPAPLPAATNRERFLQIGFQCAALPAAQRRRANHYLRIAAFAGETEALLRYVRGEGLPLTGRWDQLRDPAFLQWRQDVPVLLQRGLASGRIEVLDELIRTLEPGAPPLSLASVVPDDPESLYAYRLLRARLRGDAADPADVDTPAGIDMAGRTRAAALAERLHRERFGGRVTAGDAPPLPPLLPDADDPRPAAEATEFCARASAGAAR